MYGLEVYGCDPSFFAMTRREVRDQVADVLDEFLPRHARHDGTRRVWHITPTHAWNGYKLPVGTKVRVELRRDRMIWSWKEDDKKLSIVGWIVHYRSVRRDLDWALPRGFKGSDQEARDYILSNY